MEHSEKLCLEDSRTVASFGQEVFAQFKNVKALIIGVEGVGSEIAKHLLLNSLENLYLYDTRKTSSGELFTNFFSSPYVGQDLSKAENTKKRLQCISKSSQITVFGAELNSAIKFAELIKQFKIKVVYVTSVEVTFEIFKDFRQCRPVRMLEEINQICLENCASLVVAECIGAFGYFWLPNLQLAYDKLDLKEQTQAEVDSCIDELVGNGDFEKAIALQEDLYQKLSRILIKFRWYQGEEILSEDNFSAKVLSPDDELVQQSYNLLQKLRQWQSFELITVSTLVGSYAAFQVIKLLQTRFQYTSHPFCCTGFNYLDILPTVPFSLSKVQLTAIFMSQSFIKRLQNLNFLIPGIGALGCELLKLVSTLKFNVDKDAGSITLCDFDSVQISNLNRQYLFERSNQNQNKALVARTKILEIYPNLNIQAQQFKIDAQSELKLGQNWLGKFDIVLCGLDNVKSRSFIHSRCRYFRIPFFEMGTSSFQARQLVLVPDQTVNYDDIIPQIDTEIEFPSCTIKTFPEKYIHCLQWARDFYYEIIYNPIQLAKQIKSGVFQKQFQAKGSFILDDIKETLQNFEIFFGFLNNLSLINHKDKVCAIVRFCECVCQKHYQELPQQLLIEIPLDKRNDDGSLVWSAPRSPPKPIDFVEDELFYLFCSAVFGIIKDLFKLEDLALCIEDIKQIITFPGNTVLNIDQVTGNESDVFGQITSYLDIWKEQLYFDSCFDVGLDFKDDINLIYFLHSASNLRCKVYGLNQSTLEQSIKDGAKIQGQVSYTSSAICASAIQELMVYLNNDEPKQVILDMNTSNYNRNKIPCSVDYTKFYKSCIPSDYNSWTLIKIQHPKTVKGIFEEISVQLGPKALLTSLQETDFGLNLYTVVSKEIYFSLSILDAFVKEYEQVYNEKIDHLKIERINLSVNIMSPLRPKVAPMVYFV